MTWEMPGAANGSTDWNAAAASDADELIGLRRAIHAEPELGLDCPATSA
jgi:hippurate hydrolase